MGKWLESSPPWLIDRKPHAEWHPEYDEDDGECDYVLYMHIFETDDRKRSTKCGYVLTASRSGHWSVAIDFDGASVRMEIIQSHEATPGLREAQLAAEDAHAEHLKHARETLGLGR